MADHRLELANPTDPATLTAEEKKDIARLLQRAKTDPAEFQKDVSFWVGNPDPDGAGRRVFHSAELADHTWTALSQLILDVEKKFPLIKSRTGRAQLNAFKMDLSAQKRTVGGIREALRQEALSGNPNRDAEKIILRLRRAEVTQARRLLKDGKSGEEVYQEMRRRAGL